MRTLALALIALGLAGCEHDEHPFEVWWSASCTAEGAPSMIVVFDKELWVDDAGNRREYVGEAELQLDNELWDSWLWTVRVDRRRGTAETIDLVHVPIPDEFVQAYDLRELELEAATFEEDPEGTWARISGTCAWGGAEGELNLSMADDCDACVDCSTLGPIVPGLVVLVPVIFGIRRRQERRREESG